MPTPPTSKQDFAYRVLRQEIVEGRISLGERLVIQTLADHLNVSPIPVREALRQLEADGFVRIEPYVGARVVEVDEGLVSEVFSLMEALESVCVRRACAVLSDDQIATLEEHLRDMDALVDAPPAWAAANDRFHLRIAELSASRLTVSLVERVLRFLDWTHHLFFAEVLTGRTDRAQKQHWRLLRAIKRRDTEKAAELIRLHYQSARSAYEKHLKGRSRTKGTPS